MNYNAILKTTTDKLANSLKAILGRAVRTIKRFTTALHNKCNLVVYVDELGRTCCQFLKKDAFSGYHFEFNDNRCAVTNKETGDVYNVEFGRANYCNCPAFRYSKTKEPCKHLRMVGELRGDLGQMIAQTEFDSYIEQQAVFLAQKECTHPRVITGLDAHYCPDCKKSIEYGTALYEQLLNRDDKKPNKKQCLIDSSDIPLGCRLDRTGDHISMEYNVLAWRKESVRGLPTLTMHNIGRIVQHTDGIYTYRVRSGIARTFETTRDALAYLVRVVGTSFEEIAQAYDLNEQVMKRRIARL